MAIDYSEHLGIELEKKLEEGIIAGAEKPETLASEATYDGEQIKAIAKEDVNMLGGLAVPDIFNIPFPPVLIAAWALLRQSVATAMLPLFPKIALGIPRGLGKTTVIKLFILYCILFTNVKFILVMSSTATLAENVIADVVDMLNESNIVRLFTSWKVGLETDRTDLKKFGFRGRNIILAAIGAGGSVRGLNLKNERPDVMVFDDIQTKECSESKIQSEALERWMIGTAMKAKSPRGCLFIFAGNMFPGPHSILKKLKNMPSWTKFISGAILADGTALWEEVRSKESLIEEFEGDMELGHPEIFLSEVLNDTEAGINTNTDIALIREWPFAEHELPQGKFIIIDPSNDKATSDKVAIGYFEVYDGIPAMRDVIDDRLSPGNIIRKALLMALKTGTKLIAVEATAFQFSLLYWFNEIANQLGVTGIQFVDVYSGSYSKNSRISDAMKALTAGEIILHAKVKQQVVHQIANWNPLKRNNEDGILDLLAYCSRVLELYGPMLASETTIEVQDASSAEVVEDNHAF